MLAVLPVSIAVQELHRLLIVQEIIHSHALVRQEQPHLTAALQAQRNGTELIRPVIGVAAALVHKVALHGLSISTEQVEQALFRSGLVKLTVPLGAVVDGRGQSHNGFRVHRQSISLRFQQSSGLLIDPVPQSLIKLLAAHLATEGGGVVIRCQTVHGGLVEIHGLIQPQGVCQNACHGTVIAVIGVPNTGCLCAQSLNTFTAQQIKDLLATFTVRHLCQHGKGHVDVYGRVDLVRTVGIAEKLPDRAGKEIFQTVCIALRLTALGFSVRLPGVIDHIKAIAVKLAGLFIEILHLIGVGSHFRVTCQCKRISRCSTVGFLFFHVGISCAAYHRNQASRCEA